jgi:hypothetical protein
MGAGRGDRSAGEDSLGLPVPGAASLARPGFAVYVTRGGPGPMTTQPFLRVGGPGLG